MSTDSSCCKVGAALDRYDLDGTSTRHETFDDLLVARWTGTDRGTAQGYRPLTEWFNKRILKRVYDDHGLETGGSRLDREYDALTGDDELYAEEVRDSLRSEGVAVDELQKSFVSWSTMQRHLNDCLEAEKERQRARTDWERNSVDIAREQLESKIDDALRSLSSKGEIRQGERAAVSVSIELECPECPIRIPLTEAIDRGYVCREHMTDDPPSE
ncbi:rod-determining factor RdfA [Natronosalvus caseinilyticus]|uniref:rod-determining factor RdfA n=1 Tax=Natronosalvus caseinilyticus TaxID=2953747 RepID=UPI0028AFBBC0|nr:rod-determining factor RdfA [Natronosalvus caseinilyticus]